MGFPPDLGLSSSITDLFASKTSPTAIEKKKDDATFYDTFAGNWFTAKPYGFRINMANGTTFSIFLPISPSNLNITTHFATNIIPTLYGTVEQHSDVRYFDINIEGNTGIASQYGEAFVTTGANDAEQQLTEAKKALEGKNSGRSSVTLQSTISAGGFFSKTLGALNQLKNSVNELVNGSIKETPGFENKNSGYAAFHTLYKTLLKYKNDVANNKDKKERTKHPLIFFNYKDGNQYNVVIRNFNMKRSADNPMLYYYSISMRGYALTGLKNDIADDQKKRLADLGLNGVDGSSILGNIKKETNRAKSVIAAATGGINVLGR